MNTKLVSRTVNVGRAEHRALQSKLFAQKIVPNRRKVPKRPNNRKEWD